MEPNKSYRPSKEARSIDTVLVRLVAKLLPPDSPEAQERAKRPLSERGPNLPRYIEEAKAANKKTPTE
jgi:hypothetical protein